MYKLLEELTKIYGPSANEKRVADVIEREIKPYVDEIKRDKMGNLVAIKKGGDKKVLFSVSMDQHGFLSTHIEDNGDIRFSVLSPINAFDILNSNVVYENGITGVIKSEKINNDTKLQDLYIDVGEKNFERVEEKLPLGSCAVLKGTYYENDSMIISSALGGRAECVCLIDVIKNLPENLNADIYFLFSAQSRIEARGNKVISQCINPNIAISIDSAACDKYDYSGKGPVLRLRDKNMISNNALVKSFRNTADNHNLHFQEQVAVDDISDVDGVVKAGIDAETISIALPVKYYLSSSEIIYKSDFMNLQELLTSFIEISFKK